VFLYQVLTVFSHDVFYPLSILNYFIGYTILTVLVVDILVNLKGLSRYVSFLTVIPVLNVLVVGILAYKLSHSLWSSVSTSLIWFVKLILSLVLPVSDILAYDFDLPFTPTLSFQSFLCSILIECRDLTRWSRDSEGVGLISLLPLFCPHRRERSLFINKNSL
jgi:hypothetical protein